MIIGIDIRNIGKKRTGDEVVFFNLAKNLAEIDQKNEYLLFTDITEKNTLDEIADRLGVVGKANFKIISLRTLNRFSWNFWALPMYLKKNPVDIYHTQYITPFFVSKKINPHTKITGFLAPLKKLLIKWKIKHFGEGVKIVTTIHDISFNFFPQFIKLADLFFLKILIPLSLKRADKIVAVSRFTRDEIIKYYGIHPHTKSSGIHGFFQNLFAEIKVKFFGVGVNPEKVEWVHNSVANDFLEKNVSSGQLEEIRKKYELPEKFIFYIGTMQPRKNLPCLVEAFGKVKGKIPGLKLVLAGGKNAYNFDKEIGKTIHKNSLSEDVIFPGFVPAEEKPAFFQLAEAFCFPSLYEGFGIPILEAFSAGTPVIASEIPAHREIAGSAALFFTASNSGELADRIFALCTDESLRNELRGKGKAQSAKFSWKTSAEKTLKIYENLCG